MVSEPEDVAVALILAAFPGTTVNQPTNNLKETTVNDRTNDEIAEAEAEAIAYDRLLREAKAEAIIQEAIDAGYLEATPDGLRETAKGREHFGRETDA